MIRKIWCYCFQILLKKKRFFITTNAIIFAEILTFPFLENQPYISKKHPTLFSNWNCFSTKKERKCLLFFLLFDTERKHEFSSIYGPKLLFLATFGQSKAIYLDFNLLDCCLLI